MPARSPLLYAPRLVRLTRRLLLIGAALAIVGGDAEAQLRGTVTTSRGHPLATVLVELWRGGEQLGFRVTDSTGRFGFSASESRGATEISARRIGFTARRKVLARGDSIVRLELEGMSSAPTLAALARVAAACPNAEDREARSLWQSIRRRYLGADSVELATLFSAATSMVSAEDLGSAPQRLERQGKRALPASSRSAWRRRIAMEGYAWLRVYRDAGLISRTWEYPPLESDFAQHFLDHVFGRMHRLSVVSKNEGELVLAFCPSSTRVPALSGLLIFAPDTTLLRATWQLRAPDPVETVGGEVYFAPYDPSRRPQILLPTRGLFWREHPDGGYQQRWQSYDRWVVERVEGARRISAIDDEP